MILKKDEITWKLSNGLKITRFALPLLLYTIFIFKILYLYHAFLKRKRRKFYKNICSKNAQSRMCNKNASRNINCLIKFNFNHNRDIHSQKPPHFLFWEKILDPIEDKYYGRCDTNWS